MSNDRLVGAIGAAGMTTSQFAEKLGVDPKTIERWVTRGRVPHRTNRVAASALLGVDEGYLWPSVADDPRRQSASRAELVEFYPTRASIPAAMWTSLIAEAVEAFDLLAFAALPLVDQTDFVARLAERAEAGVHVRVLLGDPAGPAVALRGREEGMGASVASRVALALGYFRDGLGMPGFEVRLHDTTLYASIYRSDNTMLANVHVYGSPAGQSPVLHLQRVPGGRCFAHYARSFDRVWTEATPIDRNYVVPS